MHVTKTNEMLHLDYCFMEAGEQGNKYVLILKEDLSGYVMLRPKFDEDAETTSRVLIEWFTAFRVVHIWISDRGSHFKNKFVREIKHKLHAHHHFTLPYFPWANGTLQVVCQELLRETRALLSELQIPTRS